jgi:hypothetical protein
VPICTEIEEQTRREVAVGSVNATLERLEEKGFVSSELGNPTAERGGRAKKYFRITANGVRSPTNAAGFDASVEGLAVLLAILVGLGKEVRIHWVLAVRAAAIGLVVSTGSYRAPTFPNRHTAPKWVH